MNFRRPQPGDYQVLQGEIAKLRQEHAVLERRHADITTALKAELAKDAQWFNESEVREYRQKLARIEQRRGLLVDRIAALEERLPTSKERREAQREAQTLIEAADEACQKFAHGWDRCLKGLEETAAIGSELIDARTDARDVVYPLADLVAEHGLDVTVPKMPEPPRNEALYAELLATRLRYISRSGESESTVERDLAAERRRREHVAG